MVSCGGRAVFIRLMTMGLRTTGVMSFGCALIVFLVSSLVASVAFEFVTGPHFWSALANDLEVGGRVKAVTTRLMEVVPVESLKRLEPALGKERTSVIVSEAGSLRAALSDRLSREASQTAEVLAGETLPAYLMGRIDAETFRGRLVIDLSEARNDIEASLTASGVLVIEAFAEAVEARIDDILLPLSKKLDSELSVDQVIDAVDRLETQLVKVQEVAKEIRELVAWVGPEENNSLARHLQRVEALCSASVSTARQRIAELRSAPEAPSWSLVLKQLHGELRAPFRKYGADQAAVVGEAMASAIVGTGQLKPPQELVSVLIQPLLPLRALIKPLVHTGEALLVLIDAMVLWLVLALLFAANRTKYFLLAGAVLVSFVSGLISSLAHLVDKVTQVGVNAVGGLGTVVEETGFWVGKLVQFFKGFMDFFTDHTTDEAQAAWFGWNTSDVTAGAVYQVIQSDGVAVMLNRADGLGTFASLLFVCGLGLWVAEWISRKRTGSGPGTLSSYLGQTGGIRNSDFAAMTLSFFGQRSFPDSENKTASLRRCRQHFRLIVLDTTLLVWMYTTVFILSSCAFAFASGVGIFLLPGASVALAAVVSVIVILRLLKPAVPTAWGLFTNAFDSDFDSHRDDMTRWDALKGSLGALCLVFMGSLVAWLSGAFVVTWVMSWLVLVTAEALLILQSRGKASSYHYLTQAGVKPQTQVEEENDDNRF